MTINDVIVTIITAQKHWFLTNFFSEIDASPTLMHTQEQYRLTYKSLL